MNTIAWIGIFVGAVLMRQVAVGRSSETVVDLKDIFLALVTGDWDEAGAVLQREGTSAFKPVDLGSVGETVGGIVGSAAAGAAVLTEARKLGSAASRGYVYATAGPDSYDCSGLVWRAMANLGYQGARFSTEYWKNPPAKVAERVTQPAPGDIVVWFRSGEDHMGIVSGSDKFYGAQSPQTGIKELPMNVITGTRYFYRLKATAFSNG